MSPSTPAGDDAEHELPYDARVAAAMNRVLEAETSARAAIADCETEMRALLEHARQRRRNILERAHDRIMTLHARTERAVLQRTSRMLEQSMQPPVDVPAQGARDAHFEASIGALVEGLIGPCR
jgi:hypothetical protein